MLIGNKHIRMHLVKNYITTGFYFFKSRKNTLCLVKNKHPKLQLESLHNNETDMRKRTSQS